MLDILARQLVAISAQVQALSEQTETALAAVLAMKQAQEGDTMGAAAVDESPLPAEMADKLIRDLPRTFGS